MLLRSPSSRSCDWGSWGWSPASRTPWSPRSGRVEPLCAPGSYQAGHITDYFFSWGKSATLFSSSGEAPQLMSSLTTSVCPPSVATCSGVESVIRFLEQRYRNYKNPQSSFHGSKGHFSNNGTKKSYLPLYIIICKDLEMIRCIVGNCEKRVVTFYLNDNRELLCNFVIKILSRLQRSLLQNPL